MDTDLRASLVAAVAAALLSAIVGIFARVDFGALLLRAVLGGALLGGLVYGGLFLARRLLPGLAPGEAKADGLDDDEAGFRGRAVDIVLPGEGPAEFPAGAAGLDGSDEELESLPEAAEQGGEAPAPAERAAKPSVASSSRRASGRGRGMEAAPAEESEELGSLIDPEGPDGGPVAVPRPDSPGRGSMEELDVLPDLDGFSDSFAPAEYHGASSEKDTRSSRRPAGGAPSGSSRGDPRTDSLDPAQLAQAVRTILKRDQKG